MEIVAGTIGLILRFVMRPINTMSAYARKGH
jgi:hypothetical protein